MNNTSFNENDIISREIDEIDREIKLITSRINEELKPIIDELDRELTALNDGL